MPTGIEEIRAILRADKKQGQKILRISAVLFIALCIVILCTDCVEYDYFRTVNWITPWQAAKNLVVNIQQQFTRLWWWGDWRYTKYDPILANMPNGFVTWDVFLQLAITVVAGAVLSLSGAVYQSAMRNPMAVPTMLGVTSSVNMTKVLLVVHMGSEALNLNWRLYTYSYGLSAVVLAVILLCGKISGGRKVSVVDMLLAGTVINRLLNSVVNYLRNGMDDEALLIYAELNERSYVYFDQLTNLGILCLVSFVVTLPVLLMRYSMNSISFDDDDTRCLGVNPGAMRLYAMIAGAILTTAAMIHYGNVGVIALIVPHICRYVFGTEFRRVYTTSTFFGAFLMTVGWFISHFTLIGDYQIPVGSILSVIVLPVMLWFSFKQKRGWE